MHIFSEFNPEYIEHEMLNVYPEILEELAEVIVFSRCRSFC